LHLFNIKNETAVKDLESHSALASEYQNLVLRNLVSKAHVSWHPLGLIHNRSRDFLPDVSRNIIAFNCVNNSLLIDPASKRENEIVLERT
jgi:hypothetical protein